MTRHEDRWPSPRRTTALIGLFLALAAAAGTERANHFPGHEWETRDPASLGMDAATLDRFAAEMGGRGCVIKDGYIVKAWGPQSEVGDWYSSAKPVLATLLFFAVNERRIPNVDTPIARFGWDLSPKDRTMTFRHLADMVSGYGRPEPPGAAWAYNDFAIQLYELTLFDKVYGGDPAKVSNDSKRFGALGLEDGLQWRPKNRRLLASVRDFARITWFWLNKGNWNGKQVLPRKFFDRYQHPDVPVDLPWSTQAATDDYLHIGSYGGDSNQKVGGGPGIYGFNWWFNAYGQSNRDRLTWPDAPKDTFMSLGARGNSSAIIPSLNMVVVGAFAKWGEEEPGRAEALLNQRLKMVLSAVRVGRIRLAK